MSTDLRGTKAYHIIYAELIQAARYRGTLTYKELADAAGLPMEWPRLGVVSGEYLGAISEDEARHGRPMLSAIAVSAAGEPGEGFFGLAKQLGRIVGDSAADKTAFWQREKLAVYDTWKRTAG
jgi:hypothetical protein